MGLTIINKKGHVIAATPDYWKAQKAAEKRAERAARAAEK